VAQENLHHKINEDLRTATKQKDATVVRVLRFCKSILDSAAKDLLKPELSDEEAIKVISKKIKQSREAAEAFKAGNRQELVQAEEEEVEILIKYLPKQLSEDELNAIVLEIVTETGANSAKDFGKVMGAVMRKVAGKADGATVKQAVERNLQQEKK